jgi:hypothetical protein
MITKQQMLGMPYGIRYIGQHIHIKLRFTSRLLWYMSKDLELRKFAQDLTIVYNNKGAHGHIIGVFHKNSGFVDTLYRVRKRQGQLLTENK